MRDKLMTREQAIAVCGLAAVEEVEADNCEPTNVVGSNGACQGDDLTEWSASVWCDAGTLICYYYTTNEQDAEMAAHDGDGSVIDWTVAGYEVV